MSLRKVLSHFNKQSGFTLVELLIIIVVSAIIGAAVIQSIFQTYSTYNRDISRTEANTQVGFATRYIHQDAQMSKAVYIYQGSSWIAASGTTYHNLLDTAVLLERPFWDEYSPDGGVNFYKYECFIYQINTTTKELIRSHYYYDAITSLGSPADTTVVAKFINTDASLTDDSGDPLSYWGIDGNTEYPNGLSVTIQVTCIVGVNNPQSVTGKVDVTRMMAW